MPAIIELEGAKAVKALAAAKAEGFKAGAAAAKAGAVKATAVKAATVKAVAAKTSASGILSGGAPAYHLGLGLGLGVWGPVLLVAALCAGTGACVYCCTRKRQVEQAC